MRCGQLALDRVVINDGLKGQLRELVQYRYLLQNLVVRDLKVRYKNSLLGVLWSLLNPLLMMVVFTTVFTIAFRNDSIPNYAIFILVGPGAAGHLRRERAGEDAPGSWAKGD